MEWIVEAVSLIFIGLLILSVAILDQGTRTVLVVYAISAGELVVVALASLFTGYKADFLPFKLCPFIFSACALLILLGAFLCSGMFPMLLVYDELSKQLVIAPATRLPLG
jgi:hypothetical protein